MVVVGGRTRVVNQCLELGSALHCKTQCCSYHLQLGGEASRDEELKKQWVGESGQTRCC